MFFIYSNYHERGSILSNPFFASVEIIMQFLSFILLMWGIMFIDVCYVETFLQPKDKFHLIMVYDPFIVLSEFCLLVLVEDFCIYFHQSYCPIIFL